LHKNQNIDEIDSAIEALNKSWEGASQEIYKASQEQQASQGGDPSSSDPAKEKASGGKKGDDISDVDFEEVKDDDKK
jgi:molecular chaperone DnaK